MTKDRMSGEVHFSTSVHTGTISLKVVKMSRASWENRTERR